MQSTSNTKAFIHAQQYGMTKKPGVKVKNPYKHLQVQRRKK